MGKVRFGLRRPVEVAISALKRVFGQSAGAFLPHTAYTEIATKISAYSHTRNVWDRAVREARAAA